tara:strand:+ start:1117 stop:1290 length:174 start_codon:yes stop_codon:yes gene_type:complete
MEITLFESIIVVNLIISAGLAYKFGQIKGEIDTLYEGLAMVMTHLELAPPEMNPPEE